MSISRQESVYEQNHTLHPVTPSSSINYSINTSIQLLPTDLRDCNTFLLDINNPSYLEDRIGFHKTSDPEILKRKLGHVP